MSYEHQGSLEFQLVMAILAADFDPKCQERCHALLQAGVDWDRVIALADHGGVACTFMHNLEMVRGTTPCPESKISSLRERGRAAVRRTEQSVARARQVDHTLRRKAIVPVFSKGLPMHPLMPLPGLRRMCDVDVWVAHDQFEATLDVLEEELGYAIWGPSDFRPDVLQLRNDRSRRNTLPNRGHVEQLARRSDGGEFESVDLNTTRKHYELWLVDVSEVIQDARPVVVQGEEFLVPSDEDHVVLLCDHLHGHQVEHPTDLRVGIKGASELYRYVVLRGSSICWSRVAEKAIRYAAAHRAAWARVEGDALAFARSRKAFDDWLAPAYLDPLAGLLFGMEALRVCYGFVAPPEIVAATAQVEPWLAHVYSHWAPEDMIFFEWTGPLADRLCTDASGSITDLLDSGLLQERARIPSWVARFLLIVGTAACAVAPESVSPSRADCH